MENSSNITAGVKVPLPWLPFVVTASVLLLAWELSVRTGLTDPAPLPPASRVLHILMVMASDGSLWQNTVASLRRVSAGYALAIVVALPLGFGIGWYRSLHSYLDLPVQTLRQVPTLAWIPVSVLIFGIGELPKVLLIMLVALWWLLIATIGAVRNVDPSTVKLARSIGVSGWGMFLKVVLPSALPEIFVALRLAHTEVILVLIAVEMVGAQSGLGRLLVSDDCHSTPDHTMYYSVCIYMGLIGLVVNYILVSIERRFFSWKGVE
jgi:NitT/TauT family transport system permease protein